MTADEVRRFDTHGLKHGLCSAQRSEMKARFCALDVMAVSRGVLEHRQNHAGCWHIVSQVPTAVTVWCASNPSDKRATLRIAAHKPSVRCRNP